MMSTCTTCNGTGKVPCPTCHGEGLTTRKNADGETVQRLCTFCGGDRQIRCGFCRGTGKVATLEEAKPQAAKPAVQQVDRLAGRWTGAEGTWYEFHPDGGRYKVTAGGLRGATGSGTATLLGHQIHIDATDALCGHYTLELTLHGYHMDGIDRKAGFPVPVVYHKA